MSTLERAIEIATEAHRGQRDQVGGGHPLRQSWLCAVLYFPAEYNGLTTSIIGANLCMSIKY